MKKVLSITLLFITWITPIQAQTTLAIWSFPTGTSADQLPNTASVNNVTKSITAEGGVGVIDFSKNGATTKAAQATGWDNGKDAKFWQIEINSTGYKNLLLNSKLSTGGTFPGPRDFKLQYKVGAAGTWKDVDSSNFKTANNWTTGVLNNIEISGDCDNQASVFIRWIMTSDTANDGTVVAATGICKIDDIKISASSVATLPVVSTDSVTQITSFSAVSGGNITNDGGASVSARGVCWSTSPNPTISGSKTTEGTGAGKFTSTLNGLTSNQTYYVRAYATNSAGTAYGDEVIFKTLLNGIQKTPDQDMNFVVYPNPSRGIFTIKNIKQTESIEIYNSMGVKVYECINPLTQINVDLLLSGKGIYIVKSGNYVFQKIMIR
jgi:hypothetical protein